MDKVDPINKRKTYYQLNKEKIRQKAVEYYHKKKLEDPLFYDMILLRNNSYYHKVKIVPSDPIQDEAQMNQIIEWTRRVNNGTVF